MSAISIHHYHVNNSFANFTWGRKVLCQANSLWLQWSAWMYLLGLHPDYIMRKALASAPIEFQSLHYPILSLFPSNLTDFCCGGMAGQIMIVTKTRYPLKRERATSISTPSWHLALHLVLRRERPWISMGEHSNDHKGSDSCRREEHFCPEGALKFSLKDSPCGSMSRCAAGIDLALTWQVNTLINGNTDRLLLDCWGELQYRGRRYLSWLERLSEA